MDTDADFEAFALLLRGLVLDRHRASYRGGARVEYHIETIPLRLHFYSTAFGNRSTHDLAISGQQRSGRHVSVLFHIRRVPTQVSEQECTGPKPFGVRHGQIVRRDRGTPAAPQVVASASPEPNDEPTWRPSVTGLPVHLVSTYQLFEMSWARRCLVTDRKPAL